MQHLDGEQQVHVLQEGICAFTNMCVRVGVYAHLC